MRESNGRVQLINHIMAKNLQKKEEGWLLEQPILSFYGIDTINSFHSLDQFLCKKGKHKAFIRIVHPKSGTIIQGTDIFIIDATTNNFTYEYNINWNYEVSQGGVYEYQIFVNGKQLAAFQFIQYEEEVL